MAGAFRNIATAIETGLERNDAGVEGLTNLNLGGYLVNQSNRQRSAAKKAINKQETDFKNQIAAQETDKSNAAAREKQAKMRSQALAKQLAARSAGRDATILGASEEFTDSLGGSNMGGKTLLGM
jgi:hypothetical protein